MKRLRILLADDHGMFRQGIKLLLQSQPDMEISGEAADGEEALLKLKSLMPDLLVMDISMPKVNGLQLIEQVKRSGLGVRVVVLTAFSEAAYLRHLLSAGVAGYVLKQAAAEELIDALRAVAAGGTYLDPAVAGKVVSGFVEKKKLRGARDADALSEREREVLRYVAHGFTNKEIAVRLRISVKTVETHKANLMEKLDLHSRSEIVRYALLRGWLQQE